VLSTFGSRAVTNKFKKEDLTNIQNAEGQLLTDALASAGGNPSTFEKAVRHSNELSAFL
jgi:N-carbamoyl-L-amino-acid hydrolase